MRPSRLASWRLEKTGSLASVPAASSGFLQGDPRAGGGPGLLGLPTQRSPSWGSWGRAQLRERAETPSLSASPSRLPRRPSFWTRCTRPWDPQDQRPPRALPHPRRPGHRRAWSRFLILSGLMLRLWPGVRAQGMRCSLHLLGHGPEISTDIIYYPGNTCRNKIKEGEILPRKLSWHPPTPQLRPQADTASLRPAPGAEEPCLLRTAWSAASPAAHLLNHQL